uniref:Uncharacterized protein n=1 Tax=Arundo donax TaxID=35708 RepID=A0A0A9CRG6_ARUDO
MSEKAILCVMKPSKLILISPCKHLSTRSGNWDLPLKSPKIQPVIRRPSKSSIGWSGIILGVAWIPSTTVRPQPSCVDTNASLRTSLIPVHSKL